MAKTINKNRKVTINKIIKNAFDIKSYNFNNNFSGEIVSGSTDFLKENMDMCKNSKLTDTGNGSYHLYIHSNCWYEFKSIEL